jgi:hypothetical protein
LNASPTLSTTQTSTSSDPSELRSSEPFFNLPSLLGALEADLEISLGPQVERTESYAVYRPAGCAEVSIRIVEGRAQVFTIYLSEPEDGQIATLARVGIVWDLQSMGNPSSQAPAASWWRRSEGAELPCFAEIGTLFNMGGTGGWDCVQVVWDDKQPSRVAPLEPSKIKEALISAKRFFARRYSARKDKEK